MPKDTGVKSINDVAPRNEVVPDLVAAQDLFGVQLELRSFRKRTGEFSDFYILECGVVGTDDTIHVSTGSYMVEAQLEHLTPRTDLPCSFQMIEEGKSYYMG